MKWLSAIGEGFKLLSIVTDPAKRKEAYSLHLQKRNKVALEAAEKFILLTKECRYEESIIKKKKIRKQMHHWERVFFKYN